MEMHLQTLGVPQEILRVLSQRRVLRRILPLLQLRQQGHLILRTAKPLSQRLQLQKTKLLQECKLISKVLRLQKSQSKLRRPPLLLLRRTLPQPTKLNTQNSTLEKNHQKKTSKLTFNL